MKKQIRPKRITSTSKKPTCTGLLVSLLFLGCGIPADDDNNTDDQEAVLKTSEVQRNYHSYLSENGDSVNFATHFINGEYITSLRVNEKTINIVLDSGHRLERIEAENVSYDETEANTLRSALSSLKELDFDALSNEDKAGILAVSGASKAPIGYVFKDIQYGANELSLYGDEGVKALSFGSRVKAEWDYWTINLYYGYPYERRVYSTVTVGHNVGNSLMVGYCGSFPIIGSFPTKDCLDHDLCTEHSAVYGNDHGHCNDEFDEAVDDAIVTLGARMFGF